MSRPEQESGGLRPPLPERPVGPGAHTAGDASRFGAHPLSWKLWLTLAALTVATLALLVVFSPRLHPPFDPDRLCTAIPARVSPPQRCA